jgi:RNA polymerase sigma factor (sigma-70 family)
MLGLAADERLVELVRAGSEPAFEAIYDRHHRGVLGFCRHMLGSQDEAEDAVQHTFFAAYADLRTSAKPIQLRAWLYTIARNRCISVLRARREQPAADLDEVSTENLSAAVQRRQDLRDLLGDLAALPDEQRAALVLAEFGSVPHDEIAIVLGVPRDKVKALVYQGRSSLIASRQARDTPCAEIRPQLASLRAGALRRTTLRRHLRECAGCRGFRTDLVALRLNAA